MDFDSLCKGLGVQLDLTQSSDRACFIPNTKKEFRNFLTQMDGVLSRSEREKLRGRLQFPTSQFFGRKFRRLLKVP